MSLVIVKEQVPLKIDSHGVARVGGTRVTLDTVIATFNEGATAEEIVIRYPSLHLADVYAVLSYYLRHQQEVKTYLHQRQNAVKQIRNQNQTLFDSHGVRERLLARKLLLTLFVIFFPLADFFDNLFHGFF
ncbi:MAG: DUF433 domain-containing protein [Candidatus Aminicenantes bacterium]|nr:MAG: DUF433 domain-containing protein [Candidatus Aminicenantes bacterium]